jgi:LysM repeat protein
MPADLPISRRTAPSARSGGFDSPIRGILLGMAIGAVVMLIIGITWLVIDKYRPPRATHPAALPSAPSAPTEVQSATPASTQALTSSGQAGFAPREPTRAIPSPTEAKAAASQTQPAPTQTLATPKATLKPGAPTSRTPQQGVTPTPLTYTVQPGDSLYQIADRFGVDVLDLMIANHIANPSLIQPGQVFTIPGSGTVARGPQATGPKSILVDISQQHLYAYQGNTLVYSFIVSTGAYDGTLRGNFEILDKLPRPYSDAWNFWMPDWLGFYYAGGLENGFHALPVLPDGSQIWGDTLGSPTSYGCVVLGTLEAQLLYAWADVGTPVKVQ